MTDDASRRDQLTQQLTQQQEQLAQQQTQQPPQRRTATKALRHAKVHHSASSRSSAL